MTAPLPALKALLPKAQPLAPALPKGVGWRLWAARARLLLEQAWPTLRLLIAGWGAHLVLGLFGLWLALPWAKLAALLALTAASGWLLWRLTRHLRWPTLPQALALIERDSAAPRGALRLLADRPVNRTDPTAVALWAVAQARVRTALKAPALAWPRLPVVAADRWALAPALLLLGVLGVMVAGSDARGRLDDALSFTLGPPAGLTMTAWIVPPAYTGQPTRPITLQAGGATLVQAPAGSRLRVTFLGIDDAPVLTGGTDDVFATRAGQGFTLDATLSRAGDYRIAMGWRTLARLNVELVADAPPAIRFTADPQETANKALVLGYGAEDDYGLAAVQIAIGRGEGEERVSLPDPPPGRMVEASATRDLTASRWAGEVVPVRLVAVDAQGQEGFSEPLRLRLPERVFTHPVAQQVIAVRKLLFRSGGNRERATRMLSDISTNLDAYEGNLTTFAALRGAVWRLRGLNRTASVTPVTDWLWQVALALERDRQGGDLDDLRRRFEDLLGNLDGKSPQELGDLLERLQAAMANHLAGLMQKAIEQGALTAENAAAAAAALDPRMLEQLVEEIRDRLAAGDEEGARAALQALQSVMENLTAGGGSAQAQAAQAAMQALAEVRAEQQQLARETQAGGGGGEAGAPPQPGSSTGALPGLAPAQQGLAGRAEGAGEGLPGGGPPQIGAAGAAMREAAQALAQGDRGAAQAAQARALAALDQAMQSLAEQAAEAQAAAMMGLPQGVDPLGRFSGAGASRDFRVSTDSERRAVQAIRRILEERAADPNRSPAERDYLYRLLRRFE
jgi:uncharacterized protein (TIGR02302 family)